jgi:hypothetical protein
MRPIFPSDLRTWAKGPAYVAVDTETSGLYADDGARVSTVSVAWFDIDADWAAWAGFTERDENDFVVGQYIWDGGIATAGPMETEPGRFEQVMSFAWPIDQGVAGTGKAEDDGQGALFAEAANLPEHEYRELLTWLDGRKHIYHHAKFDLWMFLVGCRRWPGLGVDFSQHVEWDTQNGNHLLFPECNTTSLKGPGTASEMLWGVETGDEKKKIADYLKKRKLPAGRWDLMPWDIVAKYADFDARLTLALWDYQTWAVGAGVRGTWLDGQKGRMDVWQAIQRRLDVSLMLFRVEQRGLPFDVAGSRATHKQAQERIRALEAKLPFSPATLPAAKNFWFGNPAEVEGALGLEPLAYTEKGAPQVNAFIIGKMVDLNVQGAADWRELQKISTADARWFKGYADMAGRDERLRGTFRQNGTASGRFSIERVQLQAIPHNYRLGGYAALDGLPTPRDLIGSGVPHGLKLWELDLANAELRVAAWRAKCVRMLEMIEAGMDLHGETAKELFGAVPGSDEWGQVRNVAKRGNFSFIFGVGWETFQEDVETQTGLRLSEQESKRIVRDWNALYPQYREAIDYYSETVVRRYKTSKKRTGTGLGYITLANGERRWFTQKDVEFRNKYGRVEFNGHKAFNQWVQPSLAQFGIDWWLGIDQDMREVYGDEPVMGPDGTYWGRLGLVCMIHDSAVLLVPDDDQGESMVRRAQERGVDLWSQRFPGVPGGVDAKVWGGGD